MARGVTILRLDVFLFTFGTDGTGLMCRRLSIPHAL